MVVMILLLFASTKHPVLSYVVPVDVSTGAGVGMTTGVGVGMTIGAGVGAGIGAGVTGVSVICMVRDNNGTRIGQGSQ